MSWNRKYPHNTRPLHQRVNHRDLAVDWTYGRYWCAFCDECVHISRSKFRSIHLVCSSCSLLCRGWCHVRCLLYGGCNWSRYQDDRFINVALSVLRKKWRSRSETLSAVSRISQTENPFQRHQLALSSWTRDQGLQTSSHVLVIGTLVPEAWPCPQRVLLLTNESQCHCQP